MTLLTLVLIMFILLMRIQRTGKLFDINSISLTIRCFCFCALEAAKLFMPQAHLSRPSPPLQASLCWTIGHPGTDECVCAMRWDGVVMSWRLDGSLWMCKWTLVTHLSAYLKLHQPISLNEQWIN